MGMPCRIEITTAGMGWDAAQVFEDAYQVADYFGDDQPEDGDCADSDAEADLAEPKDAFAAGVSEAQLESADEQRELRPFQFVDALLGLAMRKFGKDEPKPGTCLLVDGLEKLITAHLLPHEVSDEFRILLQRPSVREVLSRQRLQLYAIFRFYAALDFSSVESQRRLITMNAREFAAFCKDTGLMDAKLTSKAVKQIFAKCQQLSEDDDDDDNELVFPEFQEAVCNLAMHRIPNPYTPFAKVTRGERAFPWHRRLRYRRGLMHVQRLETFLTEMIYPTLPSSITLQTPVPPPAQLSPPQAAGKKGAPGDLRRESLARTASSNLKDKARKSLQAGAQRG